MSFSMCAIVSLGMLQFFKHLVIPLKNLNCIPSLLLFGKRVNGGFLDMSDSMLNRATECVFAAQFLCFGLLQSPPLLLP